MANAEYKLYGSKRPGQRVDRVIVEGTTADPKVFLDVNGEGVSLSEDQVKELRSQGLDVRKSGEADDTSGDNPEDQRKAGDQTPPGGETTSPTPQSGRTKS